MLQIYDLGTASEARRKMMGEREPFDEYIDQFTLGGGVFGISMNFRRSGPQPTVPGNIPSADQVGTIRMSLEHFKVMAFLMKRQMVEIEDQFGVEIPLPPRLMNNLKIAPEDWEKFWKREK